MKALCMFVKKPPMRTTSGKRKTDTYWCVWQSASVSYVRMFIGGCPINVVFKISPKTNIGTMVTQFKIFEENANETILECVKLDKRIFKYDTFFHFWYHTWHFWILLFLVFYGLTFISKTGSLKHVSDKALRAKWPHWTYGDIMFLSKSWIYNWICH